MGYSIGTRIIEDFLARSSAQRCRDLREVADVLAKVGFKSFLNITPTVLFPNQPPTQPRDFILQFDENPLTEFVELPEDAIPPRIPSDQQSIESEGLSAKEGLWYSNVLCGVIRGALEMVCSPSDTSIVR